MLFTYLLGAIIAIVLILIAYSTYIEGQHVQRLGQFRPDERRDMWKAALLDCEYEPAKYVFGPGKVIPPGRTISRDVKDESFSSHMKKK